MAGMFDLSSIFGQGGTDPGGVNSISFLAKGLGTVSEQFMIGAEQRKLSTARDLEMTAKDKAIRVAAGREITSQSGRGENLDLESVANKTYEQELAKVVRQQEYSIASTALKDEKSMRLIGGLSEMTVSAIAGMGGDAPPVIDSTIKKPLTNIDDVTPKIGDSAKASPFEATDFSLTGSGDLNQTYNATLDVSSGWYKKIFGAQA